MAKCYFCGRQIEGLPYVCRRCGETFCSDHRLPEYHNCRGEKHSYTKNRKGHSEHKNHVRKSPKKNRRHKHPRKSPSRRLTRQTKQKIAKTLAVLAIVVALILFYPQIVLFVSQLEGGSGGSTALMQQDPSSTKVTLPDTTPENQAFKASDIPIIGDIIDPSESFKDSPKPHNYPYYAGGRKTLSFTTYGGLNEYFSKESHTYRYDYVNEVIMELLKNSYQDEYLEPLIEQIEKTSSSPDTQARVAISLVQHIPYSWNRYSGMDSDWYYPYETLHNNQGVCSDKSLLLSYLLCQLGYDVVLFEFSDHMAVGVKCNSQYDFQNSGYAFIETTRPTIITYVPEDYLGGFRVTSDVKIIHVQGGDKSLDVSEEYQDAQELKKLDSMGQVLDQYHYARWQALTQKYDLLYDT